MYLIGHRARPAGNLPLQPRHRGLWSRWYAVALSGGRAASTGPRRSSRIHFTLIIAEVRFKTTRPATNKSEFSRNSARVSGSHGDTSAGSTSAVSSSLFFFLHNKLTIKMIHRHDSERFVLTNAGEIYCCWLTATQTQHNLLNEETYGAVYGSNSANATRHKLNSRRVERQNERFWHLFFFSPRPKLLPSARHETSLKVSVILKIKSFGERTLHRGKRVDKSGIQKKKKKISNVEWNGQKIIPHP